MGSREDEMHLILQCKLYDDLRSQFTELYGDITSPDGSVLQQGDDDVMNSVMNVPRGCADASAFWRSMAAFLLKSKACRNDVVAGGDIALDFSSWYLQGLRALLCRPGPASLLSRNLTHHVLWWEQLR